MHFEIIAVIKNSSRNSRLDVFCRKLVLKSVTKFTGKHLCTNFSFNKVATLRPVVLLKKDSGTCVFQ